MAALFGEEKIAALLLEYRNSSQIGKRLLETKDLGGNRALHYAAQSGKEMIVEKLLHYGAMLVAYILLGILLGPWG